MSKRRSQPPSVDDPRMQVIRDEYPTTDDVRDLARRLGWSYNTVRRYAHHMRVCRVKAATASAISAKREEFVRPDTSGIVAEALAARPPVQCVVQQWRCAA